MQQNLYLILIARANRQVEYFFQFLSFVVITRIFRGTGYFHRTCIALHRLFRVFRNNAIFLTNFKLIRKKICIPLNVDFTYFLREIFFYLSLFFSFSSFLLSFFLNIRNNPIKVRDDMETWRLMHTTYFSFRNR